MYFGAAFLLRAPHPPPEAPLPLRAAAAILLLHLGGVALVARLAHWPLPLALLSLLGLVTLAASKRGYGLCVTYYVFILTPLCLPYLIAALRLLLALAARAQGLTSGALTVPEPWGGWLNLNWAFAVGALWALAARLPGARRGPALAAGLAALAFGWAAFVYIHSAPAGVTGSDPYAYVQMAVDLAERGTFRHAFPLAAVARGLGLPLFPVAPVGYRPPDAANLSATVWPPGFSALLAVAYRLAGERGLVLLNPILGLASLAATGGLALRLFPRYSGRWLMGALAALWLAASPEQTTRLLVPLADVAAQLFTTVAMCLVLGIACSVSRIPNHESRITHYELPVTFYVSRFTPSHWLWFLLAGLSFGLAYFTRYTQLLIAPGVVYLLWTGLPGRRQRWAGLAVFGLAALAVALPDLLYHQQAFGSPFRVGSAELGLFRLEAIPAMAGRLARELFAPGEFLWVLPFVTGGLALMGHEHRRALIGLGLAFGPLVLFHLPYPYLRLRDLLPIFPVVAVVGAFGAVEAAGRWLRGPNGLRVATIALILAAPLARWHAAWPFAQGFYTFGYLNAEQRDALGQLAELTSPGAVIGASLNAGAVTLYSGREIVRPADWSSAEFDSFLGAMRAAGRDVYLLDDGVELGPVVNRLRAEGRLTEVARLPGVYFEPTGGSRNLDLTLYRIATE